MDLTVIAGMVLAFSCIAIGDTLEGGNPAHLIHFTSLLIVIPTTLFAAMVATHAKYVKAAYKNLGFVFKNTNINYEDLMRNMNFQDMFPGNIQTCLFIFWDFPWVPSL